MVLRERMELRRETADWVSTMAWVSALTRAALMAEAM